MIKKVAKDLEENLEGRVSKEDYDKDRAKVKERINFLNEAALEKAEKADVKKGLTFLEDKIKEIIIVLAEERGSNPDGAIKKTPFKCLSCDKDLEAERQELTGRQKDLPNMGQYSTSQMRKRIRMVNNTTSTMQLNDD
jgi:hypothetical protein